MIPLTLVAATRWAVWRFDGNHKKVPQRVDGLGAAAVDREEDWGPYEAAAAALAQGGVDGVGFLLGDGWAGVDLDDCLDEAGQPNAWASGALRALDSYAEVSPSGRGLKVFVRARLTRNHARPGLEIYGYGRYFTVTGQHVAGTPAEPQDRADEVAAFIKKEFKRAPAADLPSAAGDEETPVDEHLPSAGVDLIEGGRNVMLTSMTGRLRRAGLDEEEILATLYAVNRRRCKPPLEEAEVQAIARSVARYAPARAEQAVDWMNEHHAVVLEAGRASILTRRHDLRLNRTLHDRSTFEDIRNFYRSRKVVVEVKGKLQERALGDFWLDHPGRREYDEVVFDPSGAHHGPRVMNLWTGFTVEPKAGDWGLFKDHVAKVMCGGHEASYEYFYRWLARLFQKPARTAEVAVAMRGRQGTGKGLVCRVVGSIFGQHYVHLTHAHHLVGHFNAHLQDTVFVFADEAVAPQDKAGESALKTLITEPTLTIERKGKDPFTVANAIHLMMASNATWMVPAGLDERRFLVVDVSNAHENDHPYFGRVTRQMSEGGRAAMLDELLKVDLTTWNHRAVPTTSALDEQKENAMNPVELWWLDKLEAGALTRQGGWPVKVPREQLYEDYLEMMTRTRRTPLMPPQFWSRLRRLVPTMEVVRLRPSLNRFVTFPSLPTCRKFWDQLTKFDHPWHEELDL